MARISADAGRVAVLGAASPAGSYVKAALADRAVPGERVALFGHESEIAVLSEYDGEARLVQPAAELDPESCAAILVCEPGYETEGLVRAADAGTLVVDLCGSIPGARLASQSSPMSPSRLIAIPHPVSSILAMLLGPVREAAGLVRASGFVLRPASDFGEAGLEELREQTVKLLRFESLPMHVFGRQLAFNVLPAHLFPQQEDAAGARIERECLTLLGPPDVALSVSCALVPLFYGHAVLLHLDVLRLEKDKVLAAWRQAAALDLGADPDTGGTLDAPEGGRLLVARVDAIPPASLRVWAVGSDAGAVAAAQAVTVIDEAGLLVTRS